MSDETKTVTFEVGDIVKFKEDVPESLRRVRDIASEGSYDCPTFSSDDELEIITGERHGCVQFRKAGMGGFWGARVQDIDVVRKKGEPTRVHYPVFVEGSFVRIKDTASLSYLHGKIAKVIDPADRDTDLYLVVKIRKANFHFSKKDIAPFIPEPGDEVRLISKDDSDRTVSVSAIGSTTPKKVTLPEGCKVTVAMMDSQNKVGRVFFKLPEIDQNGDLFSVPVSLVEPVVYGEESEPSATLTWHVEPSAKFKVGDWVNVKTDAPDDARIFDALGGSKGKIFGNFGFRVNALEDGFVVRDASGILPKIRVKEEHVEPNPDGLKSGYWDWFKVPVYEKGARLVIKAGTPEDARTFTLAQDYNGYRVFKAGTRVRFNEGRIIKCESHADGHVVFASENTAGPHRILDRYVELFADQGGAGFQWLDPEPNPAPKTPVYENGQSVYVKRGVPVEERSFRIKRYGSSTEHHSFSLSEGYQVTVKSHADGYVNMPDNPCVDGDYRIREEHVTSEKPEKIGTWLWNKELRQETVTVTTPTETPKHVYNEGEYAFIKEGTPEEARTFTTRETCYTHPKGSRILYFPGASFKTNGHKDGKVILGSLAQGFEIDDRYVEPRYTGSIACPYPSFKWLTSYPSFKWLTSYPSYHAGDYVLTVCEVSGDKGVVAVLDRDQPCRLCEDSASTSDLVVVTHPIFGEEKVVLKKSFVRPYEPQRNTRVRIKADTRHEARTYSGRDPVVVFMEGHELKVVCCVNGMVRFQDPGLPILAIEAKYVEPILEVPKWVDKVVTESHAYPVVKMGRLNRTTTKPRRPNPTRWEYLIENSESYAQDLNAQFNRLASEGWAFVRAEHLGGSDRLVFKRVAKTTSPSNVNTSDPVLMDCPTEIYLRAGFDSGRFFQPELNILNEQAYGDFHDNFTLEPGKTTVADLQRLKVGIYTTKEKVLEIQHPWSFTYHVCKVDSKTGVIQTFEKLA